MATLPHEREKMFLDDIIDDCLEGRSKLVVVLADRQNYTDQLAREATLIAEHLDPQKSKRISIFREALEFDNGAKILFRGISSPEFLRGLHPDRILIGGSAGDLWSLLMSSGAAIEPIA